jgi:hypothetical protein
MSQNGLSPIGGLPSQIIAPNAMKATSKSPIRDFASAFQGNMNF